MITGYDIVSTWNTATTQNGGSKNERNQNKREKYNRN